MPDFPIVGAPPASPTLICTALALEGLGVELAAASVSSGSSNNPTANKAYYTPFRLATPMTVVQLFVENGAGASAGNIDMGIYTEGGIRIVSSGAIAQSGISVLQLLDITDTVLLPGRYYLALVSNNATSTFRTTTNAALALQQGFGLLQEASAYPLPATATFAKATTAFLPHIGVAAAVTL